MVSWLPPGSWLRTREACPQWPCLNLPMAAWREAVSSRRLALASPSEAQAVGPPPMSGWISLRPRQAPGSRCGCPLPSGCGYDLSLCTCFCPRGRGSEAVTVWGCGLQTASQPGVAVPRCGTKIKGKAIGLRVCVCVSLPGLSCLWSVMSLVSPCGGPLTIRGSPVIRLYTSPWLAGRHASCCLLLSVCASPSLRPACVSLHASSCCGLSPPVP